MAATGYCLAGAMGRLLTHMLLIVSLLTQPLLACDATCTRVNTVDECSCCVEADVGSSAQACSCCGDQEQSPAPERQTVNPPRELFAFAPQPLSLEHIPSLHFFAPRAITRPPHSSARVHAVLCVWLT